MAVHTCTFEGCHPMPRRKPVWCDELRMGHEGNACFVIVTSQITDYATSVVLHYYSATDPTAQVRGFWVS